MNDTEVLEQNERKANKAMAFTSIVMALILAVLLIIISINSNAFDFARYTKLFVQITFPICIALLIVPICCIKKDTLKKSSFKYFTLTLFTIAVALLNVVLPDGCVLLWAVPIALAALYFNPRVTKLIFFLTAFLIIVATPLGMFFGDWDANLLVVSKSQYNLMIKPDNTLFDGSVKDRVYFINHFSEICSLNNISAPVLPRWLALILLDILPRLFMVVILAQLANGLSVRTKFIQGERIKEASYNQKINSELSIAGNIQVSVLPKEFPDSSRGELYAIMDPAKEIGGDFYDFFDIDPDHSALVIGDASGKGVPSALYMMKAQSLVRSVALATKGKPSEIMKQVNAGMCNGNDIYMFVTCWLGILDKETGKLVYVNAGHNPAIVKRGGKFEYLGAKPGIVLGANPDFEYQDTEITLEKGDKLMLYTDGVTEAHNVRSELYGEQRFIDLVTKLDASPFETITKVREDVREFTRNAEQFDDITMLMVEYRKPQAVFTKKFLAKNENLEAVQNFIIKSIKADLTPKQKNELLICIEEIFVNIASYSYENEGYATIDVNLDNNLLTLVFTDNGVAFNPLQLEDPNTKASANERRIGGLGIFMVKNLMDKVFYEYKDNKNILTLLKKY